ncbi:MAG: hypothetical protein HN811_03635, partial [Phycisphaerae bacterium]|nr:hypothetical protein [Phycisphaerae bacterium]
MLRHRFFDRAAKRTDASTLHANDDLGRRQLLGLIGQQTDSEAVLHDVLALNADAYSCGNEDFNDFAKLRKLLTTYRQLLARINVLGVAICGGGSNRSVDILYMSADLGTSEAELKQLLRGKEMLRHDPTTSKSTFTLQGEHLTASLHRLDVAADVI